jgi:hypothetical protein
MKDTPTFGEELLAAPLIPIGAGCASAGAAVGSSPARQWWWAADVLVVIGLIVFVVTAVRVARVRRGRDGEATTRLSVRQHLAISGALGAPVIAGVFLVATSTAVVASAVIPLLLWAGCALVQRLAPPALVTSLVLAGVAGGLAVASSGNLQQGFATLVQASVIMLLLVSALAVVVVLIGRSLASKA